MRVATEVCKCFQQPPKSADSHARHKVSKTFSDLPSLHVEVEYGTNGIRRQTCRDLRGELPEDCLSFDRPTTQQQCVDRECSAVRFEGSAEQTDVGDVVLPA